MKKAICNRVDLKHKKCQITSCYHYSIHESIGCGKWHECHYYKVPVRCFYVSRRIWSEERRLEQLSSNIRTNSKGDIYEFILC